MTKIIFASAFLIVLAVIALELFRLRRAVEVAPCTNNNDGRHRKTRVDRNCRDCNRPLHGWL